MVVVSYVSDNICRICQMDKMNCISNNHTIKNNGMQFVCEEDWKKLVKYVVYPEKKCLCHCDFGSLCDTIRIWKQRSDFKDFVREKLLIPGTFKR